MRGSRRLWLGIAAAASLLGGCRWIWPEPPPSPTACLPEPLGSAAAAPRAASIRLILDRSISMGGYVAGAGQESRAIGDVIVGAAAQAGEHHLPLTFATLGTRVSDLPDQAAAERFARPEGYACRGADCDNLHSHIDAALREAADGPADRLTILVTDLWLDNQAYVGTRQTALGAPLRTILSSGRAVGVLGIDAPFTGGIPDVPGVGTYLGATRRPLFVLLVGPLTAVRDMEARLSAGSSPALHRDRTRFALFTPSLPVVWQAATLRTGGGGIGERPLFEEAERLNDYRIDLATARDQAGRATGDFDASSGLPPGLQWAGNLQSSARAWALTDETALTQCRAGMWETMSAAPRLWGEAQGSRVQLALTPDAQNPLRPPRRYVVLAQLGTDRLYPNPAAGWMRDWSLTEGEAPGFAQGRPTTFRTLELADFAAIMEQQLAGQPATTLQLVFAVSMNR